MAKGINVTATIDGFPLATFSVPLPELLSNIENVIKQVTGKDVTLDITAVVVDTAAPVTPVVTS